MTYPCPARRSTRGGSRDHRPDGSTAGPDDRAGAQPRAGHLDVRDQLLGLEPDRAAVRAVRQGDVADQHPDGAAGGHPDPGRLGRADPGRCPDRPLRRAGHVHRRLAGRPSSRCCWWHSPEPSIPTSLLLVFGFFLGIARHDLRGRHPVRRTPGTSRPAAVSPPASSAPAWAAPRCRRSSRRGSCVWFGYVPAHVIIAVALALTALLVMDADEGLAGLAPEHRRRCCPKLAAAAKLPITWQMAFLYAVVLRRVRRVQHLPAHLSQDDLRLLARPTPAPARPGSRSPRSSRGRSAGCCPTGSHPKIVVMISLAGTGGDGRAWWCCNRRRRSRRARPSSRWRSSWASVPAGCSPGWRCRRRPIGSVR